MKAKRTRDDWVAMGRKGGPIGGKALWENMTPEEREAAIARGTAQLLNWQTNSTHEERSAATRKGWDKISPEEREARAAKIWETRRLRGTTYTGDPVARGKKGVEAWIAKTTHEERSASTSKGWETRRRRKAEREAATALSDREHDPDKAVVDSTGTWSDD